MHFQSEYTFPRVNLWFFTTYGCNCDCSYCSHRKKSGPVESMTKDDVEYTLSECVKAYRKKITNSFFIRLSGGEPLLVFDNFSEPIARYKKEFPRLFKINLATNGTIMSDEIEQWIEENVDDVDIGIDSLVFSKPICGKSSSTIQIENSKKIKTKKNLLTVFDEQSIDEMKELADFAIENFDNWSLGIKRPFEHSKRDILTTMRPLLKHIVEKNYHKSNNFSFDGWQFWERQTYVKEYVALLIGIMPGAIANPGDEAHIDLGRFNSDILSFINHPLRKKNVMYFYPELCDQCRLRPFCRGGFNSSYDRIDKLKERCDAIKELFEYANSLESTLGL